MNTTSNVACPIGRCSAWRQLFAAIFVLASTAGCAGSISSTPLIGLTKSVPAHSGPIDVTAGETPILANAYVTFSAATLPNSTVIQIGETNCNGPLTVSSLPALAVLSTPATLPCVSGTVSATVTETLLTYGIATIVIAASDQTFTYFINVVLPA